MIRILVMALPLMACAPQTPPSVGLPGKCSVAGLKRFIGKPSTVALANAALKRANATTARVIGPDQAVTMDYREDRLNMHIDGKNRVTRFTCG